ncbi:MAG: hypothetical protein ABSB28_10730 [Candidatus Bathyarchaeia archaeon]
MDVRTAKRLLREEIWRKLEAEGVARFPLPCFGHVPNFECSDKAAQNVRLLTEWKEAKVVFVNPDFAQQKIRVRAFRWKVASHGLAETETRLHRG